MIYLHIYLQELLFKKMATTLRRTYVNDLGKLVIEEVIDDGKILVNKKKN